MRAHSSPRLVAIEYRVTGVVVLTSGAMRISDSYDGNPRMEQETQILRAQFPAAALGRFHRFNDDTPKPPLLHTDNRGVGRAVGRGDATPQLLGGIRTAQQHLRRPQRRLARQVMGLLGAESKLNPSFDHLLDKIEKVSRPRAGQGG